MRFINWLETIRTKTRNTRRHVGRRNKRSSGQYQGHQSNRLAPLTELLEDRALLAVVNLSVSAATGLETGQTQITVTATSAAAVTMNESVTLTVTGTGITTSDYTLNTSTITIPNGMTTGTATFTVIDDADNEGTETATLTISNPTAGLTLGTASQNIAITDNDNAGTTNYTIQTAGNYRFIRNGSNLEFRNSLNNLVFSRALGTDPIVVNGTAGDDKLRVDFNGGNPIPSGGITFNGGLNGGVGDSLDLVTVGSLFPTQTYNYTSANNGSIVLNNGSNFTVNYTGLEPLTNDGLPTNLIFNLPGTADATISLSDLGGGMGRLASTTPTFEATNFLYPNASGSLTINLGNNDQTLTVTSLALNSNTDVTINGDAGADVVNLNVAAGLTNTDVLSITAETIAQTGALTVNGSSTFVTGTGTINLINAGNNFIGPVTITSATTAALRDSNKIDLATVNVTGDLAVTAAGEVTDSGVLTVGGTATITNATNTVIFDSAGNNFGTVAITSTDATIVDVGAVVIGASAVSGNLTVTAVGAITNTGVVTVGGATVVNNAGNSISLNNAGNNFTGSVSATGSALTLVDTTAINLGANTITGNLSVTAGGAVTNTGKLDIDGTTLINSGAFPITMTNGANDFTGVMTLTGSDVSVLDVNGITLGTTAISGNLTLNAVGTVSGALPVTVAGTTSITNPGNIVTLTDATNNFTGAVSVVGSAVTLRDTNAIDLGTVTASGNLSVTAGGAVSDSGTLFVAGTTDIVNAGNSVILDTAANNFVAAVSVTGSTVTLVDMNAIILGASTVTGALSVTAGGPVSDSGALVVTSTTTIANAGSTVILDNANNFTGAVSVTGSTVTLVDTNGINIGASTITGNFSLTGGGAITNSGALLVTGSTNVVNAGAAVALDNAGNNFTGTVSVTGAAVTLRDINSIDLGTSTITDALIVTAAGTVSDSGALSVSGMTTITNSGDVILNSAANNFALDVLVTGSNVTLVDVNAVILGASTISGNFSLTAGGAVTNTGVLAITGTTTVANAGNSVTLSQNNNFVGAVSVTGTAVTLQDIGAIDLGASTITGNLVVGASGPVSDSGTLTVTGTTMINNGGNSVALDSALNDFGGAVSAAGSTVTLVDANAIDLGTVSVSVGALDVTANGAVSDSGVLTIAGATNINNAGNTVTLNSANSFTGAVSVTGSDVTLNAAASLNLGVVTASGNLVVTNTVGSVSDSGVLVVAGTTNVSSTAGSVVLDSVTNNFGGAVTASGTAVTLVDVNAIDLGNVTATGALSVTAGGAVTDSGTILASTTTAIINAGNTVVLDSATNNFTGAVSVTGSTVTLVDVNAIVLGASTVTGGNLSVTAGGAVTNTGALLVTGTTNVSNAGNAVTLDNAGNNFAGAVSAIGSAITLTDSNGIDLGSITASGILTVTAAGQVTDSGTLMITGNTTISNVGNSVILNTATNDLMAGVLVTASSVTLVDVNGIDFGTSTITGNLNVTANGAITNTLGAVAVGGTTTISNSVNSVTLGNAGNDFTGAVSIAATSVTLNDTNAIVLGTNTVTGNLSVTAVGAISDSGTQLVTGTTMLTSTGSSIALDTAANNFTGTVSATAITSVTLVDVNAIDLGTVSAVDLSVTAGGNVSDSGTITTTGTTTISAPGSDIVLNTATNNFGTAVSVFGTNATIVDANTLVLGTSTVTGNLIVMVTAGAISNTGGLVVGGTTAVTGASTVSLNNAGNNFVGAISVNGGTDVTLRDVNAIDVGASSNSGFLNVTAGGAITDSGALVFGTSTTLAAGAANDITLDAANDLGTATTIVSGKNVTLNDINAFSFAGANTVSGNLVVTAGAAITDTSTSLSVIGLANLSGTAITVNAGTTNFGTLTFNSAGAVIIQEDSSMDIVGINTALSVDLDSTAGISDSGATSVTVTNLADVAGTTIGLGGSTFNAGTITFNSAGAVVISEDSATALAGANTALSLDLDSTGAISDGSASLAVTNLADFAGTSITVGGGGTATNFGTLRFSSAGAVIIQEDSATALAGVNTAASLDLDTTGAITDVSTSLTVTGLADINGTASIAIGGASSATNFGTLTFNSVGAVVVQEDSAMDIVGANTATSSDLDSAAGISDAGATSVAVTGLVDVAGTSISLGGGTFNAGTITFNSAGAVVISEDTATALAGANTAGSLDLDSTAAITDGSTSLSVTGLADFSGTAITVGGGGTATNFGTLRFSSAGAVIIQEDSATALAGVNTAASLDLDTTGAITDVSTSLTVTGLADINGTASIAIGGASSATNFGTLTFNSVGAVVVQEDSAMDIVGANTASTVDLDSTMVLTDAGGASVVVTGLVDVAGTAITLGLGTFNAGSIRFNSAGAVVISEDSATALGAANTALSLDLDSTGAITDGSTSLAVTNLADFAGTSITVGGGAISTNFGTLRFASAGAVIIQEDSDTALTGVNTAASLDLDSAGAITDVSTSVIVVGLADIAGASIAIGGAATTMFGTLIFNATGAVSVSEDDATVVSGASTAGAGLTLVSTATVTTNAAIVVTGAASITGTGITVNAAVTDTGALTLSGSDDVTVNAAIAATTSITVSAGTDGTGNVVIDGSGAETGSLTASGAGSDIDITSGSTTGVITLDGDIIAVDRITLTSNGTGAITQTSGRMFATNLQVTGVDDATLNQATNDVTTLAVDLNPGAFAYTDLNSVTIGTVGTAGIVTGNGGAGGSVTINATSGTITVSNTIDTSTGATGVLSLTGSVVVGAALTLGGGNITLNGNSGANSDLTINFPISSATALLFTSPRDIIVNASIATTAAVNITLTSDSNGDGTGGVRVSTAGQVNSLGQVTITGSNLFATATGELDSVVIESDGGTDQVVAVGNIMIGDGAGALAGSQTVVNGRVTVTGAGTITITAEDDVIFGVDGDVTAAGGLITVTADTRAGNNGGGVQMADGTVIATGGGFTIDINADGNVTIGSLSSPFGEVQVSSTSGAILDGGDAAVDVVAVTAQFVAASGIGNSDSTNTALETTVPTIAATTSSGDIAISNSGTTIIGTVNGTIGATVTSGGVGSDVTITAASPLDVNSPVSNTGGGNITLTASGTDNMNLNAAVTATGGSGSITFNAGNSILQNAGGIVSAAGTGAIDYNAGLGTVTSVISMNAAATTTSATGLITMDADLDITLAGVSTGGEARITSALGAILDGGDTNTDLSAATAALRAVTGIGTDANGLETSANGPSMTLAAVTESGAINIRNTGTFIIGTVNGLVGATILDAAANNSAADNLTLESSGAGLTVNSAVTNNDGGNIRLEALLAGTVTLNANLAVTGGDAGAVDADGNIGIFATAAGSSIVQNATSDVTADGSGGLTYDTSGAGGAITMANGAEATTATGTILMTAATGNITLGGLSTGLGTATVVTITAMTGDIVDGGDTHVEITANAAGAVVVLTAGTGIGDGGPVGAGANSSIETTIDILDASVTGVGSIGIVETNAVTLLDVDTINGSITITAGGAINADDVRSLIDSDAADIQLTATTGDIRIDFVSAGAASGDVIVIATAGAITEANTVSATDVVADGFRAVAGNGNVGTNADLLDTAILTLEGSATSGGFFLTNTVGFAVNDLALGLGDLADGATGITAEGTVRLQTSASGGITLEDPIVAIGQLVSINAVGAILSNSTDTPTNRDIDINTGSTGTIALQAGTNVGVIGNAVEIDAATMAFIATGSDVFVNDRATGIVIGTVDGIVASTSAGVVSILADNIGSTINNGIRFAHNVTATTAVIATAVDTANQGGDDVIVNGSVTLTSGMVTLSGGDAVTLSHASIIATTGVLTVNVDTGVAGNADAGSGGTVTFNGTVNATATSIVVNGGSDNDTIIVFARDQGLGTDSDFIAAPMTLDGAGGDDFYRIHNGGFNFAGVDVTIADSGTEGAGTSDNDVAVIYAARAANTINVGNINGAAAPPAAPAAAGFVDNTTTSERVEYSTTLDRVVSNGGEFITGGGLDPNDVSDIFNVQPSMSATISIHGNNAEFGTGGADTLNLDSFSNAFTIVGQSINVQQGAAPAPFLSIMHRSIEVLPLTPLGAGAAQRYDFDHDTDTINPGTISPTQTGYTRVLRETYYGVAGSTFGWVTATAPSPPASAFISDYDDATGLTSTFSDLVRDGQGANDAQVFRTDLSDGWYLVSVKTTDVTNFRVTDANNGLALTSDRTISGHGEFNFPVLVAGGTGLRLRFETAGGTGTGWRIDALDIRPGLVNTIGTPDPGTRVADGTTIDTFTGFGALNGDLVTISASMDTNDDGVPDFDVAVVAADDIDPNLAGVQVLTAGANTYTYRIQRPTASGTVFVNHSLFSGLENGGVALNYVAPSLRLFDLQPSGGVVQTGHIGVAPSDSFSSARGYGWTSTVGAGASASNPTTAQGDLTADFHTIQGTQRFSAELENGTYAVNLVLGSSGSGIYGVSVVAEGSTLLSQFTRPESGFSIRTFNVTVTDGVLDLDFTSAASLAVAGIEIRTQASVAGAVVIGPGGVGSVLANGTSIDTVTGTAPAGSTVTVSSSRGTVLVSQDIEPLIEGVQVLTSGAGTWSAMIQRPIVANTPTITVTTVDGTGSASLANAAVLQYTSNAAAGLAFDFGRSATGVTQTGFSAETGVAFDNLLGYGWQGDLPGTQQGIAIPAYSFSDLLRDSIDSSTAKTFRLEFGSAQTFQATYIFSGPDLDVAVTTGTGTALSNLSAPAGQFSHASHTVSTANVGGGVHRLDLNFSNTATQSAGWRLQGLALVATPSNPVVTVPAAALVADGTTTSTYIVSNLTAGNTYTFTVSGGATINLADADSRIAGIQHVATGMVNVTVTAPTIGQAVTFTAEDLVGTGQGSSSKSYSMQAVRRFDFNDVSSPTATGFIGINRNDILEANDAFGFVTPFVATQDRGTASLVTTVDLYRDSLFVDPTAAFRVAVRAGVSYDLRVYSGDQFTNSQVFVSVESGAFTATSAFTTPGNFTSTVLSSVSDQNGDGFIEVLFRTPTPKPAGISFGFVSGLDVAETTMLPAAATLLAASMGSGGASIDLATVQAVASVAIDRLSQSGISAADIARLRTVDIQVTDLGGRELGLAGTSIILIDINAAEHGWHVDGDYSTDEPFGGMDLLTVIMHEFGHTLGHSDLDPTLHAGDLMSGTLAAGERRDVDAAFSSDDFMYDLEFSTRGSN